MTIKEVLERAVRSIELEEVDVAKRILNDLIKLIANGTELSIKVGKNPYHNELTCKVKNCGKKFTGGGLYLNIERISDCKSIHLPICPECFDKGDLFENLFEFGDEGVLKLA